MPFFRALTTRSLHLSLTLELVDGTRENPFTLDEKFKTISSEVEERRRGLSSPFVSLVIFCDAVDDDSCWEYVTGGGVSDFWGVGVTESGGESFLTFDFGVDSLEELCPACPAFNNK